MERRGEGRDGEGKERGVWKAERDEGKGERWSVGELRGREEREREERRERRREEREVFYSAQSVTCSPALVRTCLKSESRGGLMNTVLCPSTWNESMWEWEWENG